MTAYGYARVSTREQSLDSQVADLVRAGVSEDRIFADKWSGTTANRPAFKACLTVLKPGDTLVVTKLDRLARSTSDALKIVHDLWDRDITLDVLTMGKIDKSPTGKLIYTIFAAFADFERDLIVTRTREGRDWAKAHDPSYREGRPSTPASKLRWAAQLRQQGCTWRHISKETGVSRATLFRHMDKIKNYMKESDVL